MGKDLEGRRCEERLRSLGLSGSEQSRLRGGLMVPAAPHRERRGSAKLCSLLQRQGLRERERVCTTEDRKSTRLNSSHPH